MSRDSCFAAADTACQSPELVSCLDAACWQSRRHRLVWQRIPGPAVISLQPRLHHRDLALAIPYLKLPTVPCPSPAGWHRCGLFSLIFLASGLRASYIVVGASLLPQLPK